MPAWTCKPHAELTLAELYAVLRLRSEVFVVEQNCVFLDMDGKDLLGQTEHLMAWENGELLAYCRLLEPALNDGQAVIGRVITAPAARHGPGPRADAPRQGRSGAAVARRAGLPGRAGPAQGLLRRPRLAPVTDEYIEDGIPHVGMLLRESA